MKKGYRFIPGRAAALLIAAVLAAAPLPVRAEGEETAAAAEASPYASPGVVQSNATEGWPQLEDTASDYFCVMDADTGAILGEKGMSVETPPASLTKIMTCLVALEHGDLDAQVTMTETGVAYAVSGSSNLYTQVGEVFTLRDMLYGMMLKSANDISTQIGEFVGGGSLDTFLDMMNEKAASLGCTHTHFANSCGMPNDEHYSCARDMALISQEALRNPLFREIVHTKEYTIPPTNLSSDARIFQNHHKFLVTDEYAYEGIIGGKTGYTDLAGSCLATFVERDGRTVIVIALHCMGMDNCLHDTRKLCDYGLGEFENAAVPDLSGEVLAGGLVTLPSGASISDCDVAENTETTANGATRTSRVYTWHGRGVGGAITEVAAPLSTEETASSEAAAGDAESAEQGAEEADSASAAANEQQSSGQDAGGSGEVKALGDLDSGMVRLVLIIGAAMLGIIILLIGVNVHLRKERNKHRIRNKNKDMRSRKG